MMAERNYARRRAKCKTSQEGFAFDPYTDVWRLALDNTVRLEWMTSTLGEPALSSARKTLQFYATTYAPAHARNMCERLKVFAEFSLQYVSRMSVLTEDLILNYRSSLSKDKEWNLGALRGFFRKWQELGYPGIDSAARVQIGKLRLKPNPKGEAVLLRDPRLGAFSDIEFDSVHDKLIAAFGRNQVSLEDFALVTVFFATGRRPRQIGDLKCGDLIEATSSSGFSEFVLNIPRRKQRASGWRTTFRPYALTQENGLLLKKLVEYNETRVKQRCGSQLEGQLAKIPLFPNWNKIAQHQRSVGKFIDSQLLHCTIEMLRRSLYRVVQSLKITSERTGKPLHVTPVRCRRTTGTRAARAGYGVVVIAELLDHSDTQNVSVYTENVPEHVDAINLAIGTQMAPIIQAFAGVLVDDETSAIRGKDPGSRLRMDLSNPVGNCGHFGFCGAFAPIACYTCQHFNAWIDGPHEMVLEFVTNQHFHILRTTSDSTMAHACDRTIFAINEVIERCKCRKDELRQGNDNHGS
jgi:integrase